MPTSSRPRYYRSRPDRYFPRTTMHSAELTNAFNAELQSATVNGNDLTLVFDREVLVRTSPVLSGIQTDIGANEVSVAQANDTTVVITYDASVAAATEALMPNPPSPKIRTKNAGYVMSGTFPVST